VDFFPHGHDFSLADGWVESLLHLFFQRNFSFPKKDLTFCLDNFSQNLSFALLQLRNLVLKLDGFIFKLLELLLEFVLNVEIGIGQNFSAAFVLVKQIVQLVHFEVKVLQGNLKLADLLVVRFDVVVQTNALLLKHCLTCT